MWKATGSYRTYLSSKTATLVPEFAVEHLPLDRTAALVPAFAVKANNNNNTINVILNPNKLY